MLDSNSLTAKELAEELTDKIANTVNPIYEPLLSFEDLIEDTSLFILEVIE